MKFKEIETKYRVIDLKLTTFTEAAKAMTPVSYLEAAGYDYYYVNESGDYIRYRAGSAQELTLKRKSEEKNNFIREEVNLGIRSPEAVAKFCSMLGYSFNFSIFKACFIYYYETYNIVYYVLYDHDLKEMDRFLEIEMKEDYAWSDEGAAWTELLKIEQQLKPLGLSPQSRIKKSLFEMCRKDP